MAVLNLMKVLTLCQALTDHFPISCKQGNYHFLYIDLAKTSSLLGDYILFVLHLPFLTCRYEVGPVE